MTGMEIFALTSAIKGVLQLGKGIYDWATANKGDKNSKAYIRYLKNQMNTPAVSQDDINRAVMTGQQQSTSTMNRGVADAQGTLQMQGLGNSVIATNVPLKSAQQVADRQNIQGTNIVTQANLLNKEKKRKDNLDYLTAKTKLAELRRARQDKAIEDTFGAISSLGTSYGNFVGGQELLADSGSIVSQEELDAMKPKGYGG